MVLILETDGLLFAQAVAVADIVQLTVMVSLGRTFSTLVKVDGARISTVAVQIWLVGNTFCSCYRIRSKYNAYLHLPHVW